MLKVSNLLAGYGARPLARLSDLTVGDGEAAVLTGPSGSGKTTLLLAIAGMADRLDGTIEINDTEVGRLGPRARDRHRGRHIGMVFQDLHLVPGLSALDNLLLAPYASGAVRDRDRAIALLDRLGLATRRQARAETLSRGEAQRTAIARAALLRPSLILADEPTASLDDDACIVVLDLLLEATRDSGAALLIATHDGRVKQRVANVAVAEAMG
ncbi:ABC transporter ATP-binding protein [uncultured Sphingomonas sp.]|uniref:ABC transporter ATP-binding protein n=1 Tax=uncultured Sphingomonas sp. TaxID=158754 RepID=UPI0035C963C7